LYTWGKGPLGHRDRNCEKPSLVDSLKDKKIKSVSCGSFFFASPPKRPNLSKNLISIFPFLGLFHMAAITSEGALYTWYALIPCRVGLNLNSLTISDTRGSSVWSQLGHGEKTHFLHLPKRVASLEGTAIRECSCGAYHTACITEMGQLYTW